MKFDRMNPPPLKTLEEHLWLAGFNEAKRAWVGLTDEEISAVDWKSNETLHDFAQAIEAKLREKNT